MSRGKSPLDRDRELIADLIFWRVTDKKWEPNFRFLMGDLYCCLGAEEVSEEQVIRVLRSLLARSDIRGDIAHRIYLLAKDAQRHLNISLDALSIRGLSCEQGDDDVSVGSVSSSKQEIG